MLRAISRLPVLEKFVHYWRVFREYTGYRIHLYVAVSLLSTLLESVGIGLFFPLLSSLQGEVGPRTEFDRAVAAALSAVGLEYNLRVLLVAVALLFLGKAGLQLAAGLYQSHILSRFLATLTKRVYGSVTSQDYRHFLSRNIGVLANVGVNETNRAMVALMKFATLFPSMLSIAVFSLLAVRIDWQITLAALVFGFVVLLLTRAIARKARIFSYQVTESTGALNELVLQSLGSFKYLRTTAGFGPIRARTEATVDRLASTQFRLSATSNLIQALNEPVVMLFLVAMVWQQTLVQGNSLAQVAVLGLFFFRLIKEVMVFQSCWHGFSATMGSIDLVTNVVKESERAREHTAGRPFSGVREGIRFERVSFSYGGREVLRGLTLNIPRNAMVAVVGESGSGKTTFVDLLTGILKPSAGEILIDGQSYSGLDLATLRARIGYVPQEPALFNDTILRNISFWDQGDPTDVRRRVIAAAEAGNCRAFIEELELGFDTVLGDRGVNLSGGQRQRVSIARELYKQPELLILDEATSALDSEAELAIQKSIEGLRGRLTTVVIAHRLSTIRNADYIFVLSHGAVAEEGKFSDLYADAGSQFRKYCDLQGLR